MRIRSMDHWFCKANNYTNSIFSFFFSFGSIRSAKCLNVEFHILFSYRIRIRIRAFNWLFSFIWFSIFLSLNGSFPCTYARFSIWNRISPKLCECECELKFNWRREINCNCQFFMITLEKDPSGKLFKRLWEFMMDRKAINN